MEKPPEQFEDSENTTPSPESGASEESESMEEKVESGAEGGEQERKEEQTWNSDEWKAEELISEEGEKKEQSSSTEGDEEVGEKTSVFGSEAEQYATEKLEELKAKEEVSKEEGEQKSEEGLSQQEEVIREENEAMEGEREIQEEEKGLVVSEEQTRRNRLSERRREKVERNKAEKYGVDQSSLGMKIGRSFLQSAGSVLGVRSVWETGKLLSDYYKKKGQRGALSKTTMQLLEEARKPENKSNQRDVYTPTGEENHTENGVEAETEKRQEAREDHDRPVREKIRELESKLKEATMSPKDKKSMRTEMAHVLREYRHKEKELGDVKTEKVGKLLDTYINNKEQAALTAKEAVNTLGVVAATPILRAAGYAGFSVVERIRKASGSYEKEHLKEVSSKESPTNRSSSQTSHRVQKKTTKFTSQTFRQPMKERVSYISRQPSVRTTSISVSVKN